MHSKAGAAAQGPPALVVGNSYAMGEEVSDDQTFPAHLEKMLAKRVLNGGVLGYGLDQMILRAEALVPRFKPDSLVLSFIADDIRRARMRVMWGIPKPYFDIDKGRLALRNVPVPPPSDSSVDTVRNAKSGPAPGQTEHGGRIRSRHLSCRTVCPGSPLLPGVIALHLWVDPRTAPRVVVGHVEIEPAFRVVLL